nr:methyltransferase domain-containing protein [uncultured Aquabacterium sp.]
MNKKQIFGPIDYWRMLVKRGMRLPINYFLNAHLFDLIHKTDTHTWLPKEAHIEKPPNFQEGTFYMTSWSSEIRRSFDALLERDLLNEDYVFMDIGCGKGKVCLTWQLLDEKNNNNKATIIGIDYYEPLIDIARKNHLQVFKTDGNYSVEDATSFDFKKTKKRLVAYLYNPFSESILKKVADNFPSNTIVIYNNPIHSKTLTECGFEVIYEHSGWHQNTQTLIFIKADAAHRSP